MEKRKKIDSVSKVTAINETFVIKFAMFCRLELRSMQKKSINPRHGRKQSAEIDHVVHTMRQ